MKMLEAKNELAITRELLLPPLSYGRTALGQEPFVLGKRATSDDGAFGEGNGCER